MRRWGIRFLLTRHSSLSQKRTTGPAEKSPDIPAMPIERGVVAGGSIVDKLNVELVTFFVVEVHEEAQRV